MYTGYRNKNRVTRTGKMNSEIDRDIVTLYSYIFPINTRILPINRISSASNINVKGFNNLTFAITHASIFNPWYTSF